MGVVRARVCDVRVFRGVALGTCLAGVFTSSVLQAKGYLDNNARMPVIDLPVPVYVNFIVLTPLMRVYVRYT